MTKAAPRMRKFLWKYHLVLAKWADTVFIKKNMISFHVVSFAVPADHREKMKESDKVEKYLDLARLLKISAKDEDGSDTNRLWYALHIP